MKVRTLAKMSKFRRQVRIALDIVACGEKVNVGYDKDCLDVCIYYGIKPSQINFGDELYNQLQVDRKLLKESKVYEGMVITSCSQCGLFLQLQDGTCYSEDVDRPKTIDKRIFGRCFPDWCPLPDLTKGK